MTRWIWNSKCLNELIKLRPSTSIFSEIASSATFSRISSSNNALVLPQRIKHRFDLEMMEETKMSTSLACWTEGRSVSEYTRSTSTPELYIFHFYLTRRDYNYIDISFATPSWTSLLRRFKKKTLLIYGKNASKFQIQRKITFFLE